MEAEAEEDLQTQGAQAMKILPGPRRSSSAWNAHLCPLCRHLLPSSCVCPWGLSRLALGRDGCADFLPYPCRNGGVPHRGPDVSLYRGPFPCLCVSPCHSLARGICLGYGLHRVYHDSYGGHRGRRAFPADLCPGNETDENASFYAYQLSGCATCKDQNFVQQRASVMTRRLTISIAYQATSPYPRPFSRLETTLYIAVTVCVCGLQEYAV